MRGERERGEGRVWTVKVKHRHLEQRFSHDNKIQALTGDRSVIIIASAPQRNACSSSSGHTYRMYSHPTTNFHNTVLTASTVGEEADAEATAAIF